MITYQTTRMQTRRLTQLTPPRYRPNSRCHTQWTPSLCETGPESPSYVIESVEPNRKGSGDSCKAGLPVPFLEPKYFTLEPDDAYHGGDSIVENGEHKVDFELSEDEDIKCLSPDDIDRAGIMMNGPVFPNLSYCEPPDDDPLTPTRPHSLVSSPYGYIPPITGLGTVPDRGGRRTEIITEI